MNEISVGVQSIDRLWGVADGQRPSEPLQQVVAIRKRLRGRVVWNINSTAAGGGVAEMMQSLLPYVRGAGIDARWLVIEAPRAFFQVTKRLHHALHGSPGDGSPLDTAARTLYESTLRENATALNGLARPGDIVFLHDPQTAGLAPYLLRTGAVVIWRCHIGHDLTNHEVEHGWAFLAPYLRDVPAFVFSRQAYVPPYCDHGKSTIITPSIDAFSPKNQDLDPATVRAVLAFAGFVNGPPGNGTPVFVRDDGSPGQVRRRAKIIRAGSAPAWDTPLIVQVSRWDPLKDPLGVMAGFARLGNRSTAVNAELVLAGPNVTAVADDPEGARVFEEVLAAWQQLPPEVRGRIHLALLPMDDIQENAAIVNALQRHAAIVVQKSLHEGFGLTVTEAMWKARPVVASAVGGIQDQIDDGRTGLLLKDPLDLDAFGSAIRHLLEMPAYAQQLGTNARGHVQRELLSVHELARHAAVIARVDRTYASAGRPVACPAAQE